MERRGGEGGGLSGELAVGMMLGDMVGDGGEETVEAIESDAPIRYLSCSVLRSPTRHVLPLGEPPGLACTYLALD